MQTILNHEFLRDNDGELALLLDVISPAPPEEPVFLISRDDNTGYLRRSPGDVQKIPGISPTVINDVRHAEYIVFLEFRGADVVHSYDVPTALLEDE